MTPDPSTVRSPVEELKAAGPGPLGTLRVQISHERLLEIAQGYLDAVAAHDEVYTAPDGREFGTLCAFNNYTQTKEIERQSARIASLEQEVARLREHIECAWVEEHFDADPIAYGCRFCDASTVTSPNAEIKHDLDCPTQAIQKASTSSEQKEQQNG
jgi:hypothetical protein